MRPPRRRIRRVEFDTSGCSIAPRELGRARITPGSTTAHIKGAGAMARPLGEPFLIAYP